MFLYVTGNIALNMFTKAHRNELNMLLGFSTAGKFMVVLLSVNPLTPNDPYRGRTSPLTSKRFILYIYSTNIGTEYFKHGVYSPFFLFKM